MTDGSVHRRFAGEASNRAWDLLEDPARSIADDLDAFVTAYTAEARARSHLVLGDHDTARRAREEAMEHARRVNDPGRQELLEHDLAGALGG